MFCAPLANALVRSGSRIEVPRWVGIALVVTMLPDFDIFLPWFAHRGVTHSLLAAVCLGVVVAVFAAARWGDPLESSAGYSRRAVLGFAVGAGSVVSHLVGDVITPMGIRPFLPADPVYTLKLVYAKDLGANLALIGIGLVVFCAVYRLSNDPIPADGATVGDPTVESEVRSVNP